MKKITVIDYGVGNLLSVVRGFSYWDVDVHVTSDPKDVLSAERLVLPGVGAFGDSVRELKERGLFEVLQEYAQLEHKPPFLGICVGMQLMLEIDEEFGEHEGFGMIPGRVQAIPSTGSDGTSHKIPHIGWNPTYATSNQSWEKSIFKDIPEQTPFYFVHSFAANLTHPEHQLAKCEYNGVPITAAIQKKQLMGCQFHPEKSGVHGLQVLKNFCEL